MSLNSWPFLTSAACRCSSAGKSSRTACSAAATCIAVEGVVGGLAAVDVVVRVRRLLAAALTAEQLVGPARDHLVGVHVALGARPGLPDHQRELVGQLPVGHLLRGAGDGVPDFGVEHAQPHVDPGGRELDDAQRPDQRRGHALAADLEVLQRALRLGTPVAVRLDLDRTEGVGLDANRSRVGHATAPILPRPSPRECPGRSGCQELAEAPSRRSLLAEAVQRHDLGAAGTNAIVAAVGAAVVPSSRACPGA